MSIDQRTIERAATIMKIIHLSGLPGMDEVAVKLNCGPTYDELEHAKRWARAFELAATDGKLGELAHKLHTERR